MVRTMSMPLSDRSDDRIRWSTGFERSSPQKRPAFQMIGDFAAGQADEGRSQVAEINQFICNHTSCSPG
jgi:hypothetical protein